MCADAQRGPVEIKKGDMPGREGMGEGEYSEASWACVLVFLIREGVFSLGRREEAWDWRSSP